MFELEIESGPAWWVMLLEGLATLILGVLFLTSPVSSLLALTVFLGAYWFVRGIIGVIGVGIGPRVTLGWRLFSSIVSIVAGLFVLAYPLVSAGLLPLVYVVILGVTALISGGVNIYYGATGAGASRVVLGVFDGLVGLLLLAAPYQAALAVPYVLGILLVIGGVALATASFSLRSQQHHMPHGVSPA
jgi:uncharacterized membrane protein HdeD (DUF308 family)